ncbi:O-antigen ligase family protein [Paenibacillus polymyxa]|uniref:O-antigen ligase family protein n=1 Tax=Paenibacillus polymyxa TaxID=1406 RepID=A0AAP4EBV5_PAEPO|nr:O-antigen ligase family protein [Paenibacillus polymyxa]MDH2333425.1 O-antigen ligase family protein [Paenibacillus polymyxa]
MSNPVYGKQAKTSTRDDKRPAMFWVLIVGMILFLAWAPFQAALFNGQMLDFEKPLYWAVIIASILLILAIVSYYKKFKLEEQRDWLAVLVLLLPLSYVLSLASAASHYLAMNMVVVQCIYAALFIISIYLLQDRLGNKIIHNLIMTVAYVIVGFGFINWFGQWVLAGKMVGWFTQYVYQYRYTNAVMTDTNGLRLTSVFQYANTYAAFLMAFLFAAVFCLMKSKSWYGKATHGFMLVPILVSLFLTLSRGGLVMLPVVFVLLLLFFKPARQIIWILHCAIAGVASISILAPITNMGLQLNKTYNGGEAAKAWGLLIGVSLAVAVVLWLVERYLAPKLENALKGWASRKLSNLWLPVGSVVVIGLLAFLFIGTGLRSVLPENVQVRFENINFRQHSVLERLVFYQDAAKLIKDHPVIGTGGGGWATLYEKYQDYPYTSRQAHNFFMQYLVEVGILGFVIFMSFILYIFYKYIRSYMRQDDEERDSHFLYLILALSILLHSLLDFNLSYVFMGILVFVSLGGMAAAMDSKPLKRLSMSASGFRIMYSAVIGILSIVVLFAGLRFVQSANAATSAKQIMAVSTSFEEIQSAINKDLELRPTHPDSVIRLAALYKNVYDQTKKEEFYNAAIEVLNTGLKAEPYNKIMYNSKVNLLKAKGEHEQAFSILENNISNFVWDNDWYNMLITQAYTIGNKAHEQKDTAKEQKYFQAGLAAYQKVLDGVAHIKTVPPEIELTRTFEVTPGIALSTGKIEFMSGKPAEAASILKNGLKDDLSDATNREIARYYIVALQKQGQDDKALYDKLIKADPKEKEQIAQLKSEK